MYSFVKGSSRLFVKGSRDQDDGDDLPDPGDNHHHSAGDRIVTRADHSSAVSSSQFEAKTQMASASQESREMFRNSHVRSGLKTVHTQRVIRKTTTVSLGERKETTTLKVPICRYMCLTICLPCSLASCVTAITIEDGSMSNGNRLSDCLKMMGLR